jgi:aminoglycoside phosphotransferase (APT) family kinase protein
MKEGNTELPLDKIGAFLFENNLIENRHSEIDVLQYSNGFSNLTYLLEIGEKSYVLRRPPVGAVKHGHDMKREYTVLKQLGLTFDKVPKVYAYSDDTDVLGAPFYLMEKVEGIILTFKEAKKRQIPPSEFKVISNTWLDTFVELHKLDYKALGLGELGKPEGYVNRQVTNWGKQYLKAATMDIPEALKVMQWMQDNQPTKYDHCLIHNDFKYDNVVFKDESWQEINSILDWEMCTLGDPLMDLGTSLAYWTMHSDDDFLKQGIPSPTLFEGNPGRLEIVQAYAEKSVRSIDNLVFYYVYGLFKVAVIAQQIYYRFYHGMTKNPKFAMLDKAAQYLSIRAWNVVQNGSL